MRWSIFLIVLVLLFASVQAKADPLVLTAQSIKVDLGTELTFLRDPNGSLTLDDVAGHPLKRAFTKSQGYPNFGITSDVIWLRLEIQRAPSAPAEWWLELAPAYIGEITFFHLQEDAERTVNQGKTAGLMFPLSHREFKTRHSMFKIYLRDSEPQVIYLRLRSNTQLNVRGYLWQPAYYAEESANEHLVLGIYYGAFALIVGICGLRWWINRSRVDFWWLVYLISEGYVVFRMNGLASHYLLPELPTVNSVLGVVALCMMVLAGSQFGIHAFALDKIRNSASYHAATGIGILALIVGLTKLLNLEPASTISLFLISFTLCLLNCVISYRYLKSGEPSAKFYFSGIWFMTGCVVLVLARNFGFIPAYPFIDYVWQSNVIIHALLVSYGIVLTQLETTHERRRATAYQASAEINQNYSNLQKRMLALVSHEFRNALAMLSTSMHIIGKRKDLPSDVTERHRNIVRVHQQMRKTINGFLLEERIENAKVKVLYERVDVRALIREVINLSELYGKGQSVTLDVHHLPQYLLLDQSILRLVLTNLLDNAVKYSESGSRIKLYGRYDEGVLKMSVSDNGMGMNEDSLSRIFEPHFKANLQSEGIGIGLYMVRLMLHAHEGDIRVESEVGRGSTLEFWIKTKFSSDTILKPAPEKQISH